MAEQHTIYEKISNRLFAIPAVAQWWAKRSAQRTAGLVDLSTGIPFAQLRKAQYGLQGSITQIGVVTSGVPTSIQRQILATHKEPYANHCIRARLPC
jgi:hypothetical protein